jgi:hypothetical protein
MTFTDLLEALDTAAIRLSRVGDNLRLRGSVHQLSAAVVHATKAHKQALLGLLKCVEVSPRPMLPACNVMPSCPESPTSPVPIKYPLIKSQAGVNADQEVQRRADQEVQRS